MGFDKRELRKELGAIIDGWEERLGGGRKYCVGGNDENGKGEVAKS